MSRLLTTLATGYRSYAAWLVGVSWKRFLVLSVLLMIIAGVLSNLPPFTWRIGSSGVPPAESPAVEHEEAPEDSLGAEIRREIAEELRAEFGKRRSRGVRLGDPLPELAFLLIILSAAIKIAHAGRVKAEAKAAEAQQVAEAESLKRQVAEARVAAMQAQVEPHFLFNTLASIDHLIE